MPRASRSSTISSLHVCRGAASRAAGSGKPISTSQATISSRSACSSSHCVSARAGVPAEPGGGEGDVPIARCCSGDGHEGRSAQPLEAGVAAGAAAAAPSEDGTSATSPHQCCCGVSVSPTSQPDTQMQTTRPSLPSALAASCASAGASSPLSVGAAAAAAAELCKAVARSAAGGGCANSNSCTSPRRRLSLIEARPAPVAPKRVVTTVTPIAPWSTAVVATMVAPTVAPTPPSAPMPPMPVPTVPRPASTAGAASPAVAPTTIPDAMPIDATAMRLRHFDERPSFFPSAASAAASMALDGSAPAEPSTRLVASCEAYDAACARMDTASCRSISATRCHGTPSVCEASMSSWRDRAS
mmetsp:Transcript_24192/g.61899  ORF Transcript_24192/g.61899 Transcript_24192/m.61899 type:complete len:357 (-) Transcript_24192:545-1615(-)